MERSELTPVVLFVYDRPGHAEQTLTHLAANDLAARTTLYIFSDGPKPGANPEQVRRIGLVRQVIRSTTWCGEVVIHESPFNKGLANSIIDGVTEVIHQHGRVIVLEDDLVTSPGFLNFMNRALTFYDPYKAVFSIAADRPYGARFVIPDDYSYDVFASLRPFSYGWATWSDRWSLCDWSMEAIRTLLSNEQQGEAFCRGGEDLDDMLEMQMVGKIDSWAIRFALSHFKHHGVAILPTFPYVENIGYDGSGTNCLKQHAKNKIDFSRCPSEPRFLDVVYEDARIINSFYSYYYPKKRPIWKKGINMFSRLVGGNNLFTLKGKVYTSR